MFFGGFELAPIFPQLRRNEIEIHRAVQIGFVVHLWDFLRRFFLFRFRLDRERGQPVLVECPASFKRATAQLDVVLLVPGKVSERKRVFRGAHHAQITLDARTKPHTGFSRTLGDNRFYQRMTDKKLRDRFRFFCRH